MSTTQVILVIMLFVLFIIGLLVMFKAGIITSKEFKKDRTKKRLNEEEYQELIELIKRRKKERGIEKEVNIYSMRETDKGYNAEVSVNRISFSNLLLEDFYNNKDSKIMEFFLGHELTHLQYRDIGLKMFFINIRREFFKSHKANVFHILKELRADIEAALYGNLSVEEYINTLECIAQENDGVGWRDILAQDYYKKGYPSKLQRIKYPVECKIKYQANDLSRAFIEESVLKPLIGDYCDKNNISESKRGKFVKGTIMKFWKDCKANFKF